MWIQVLRLENKFYFDINSAASSNRMLSFTSATSMASCLESWRKVGCDSERWMASRYFCRKYKHKSTCFLYFTAISRALHTCVRITVVMA